MRAGSFQPGALTALGRGRLGELTGGGWGSQLGRQRSFGQGGGDTSAYAVTQPPAHPALLRRGSALSSKQVLWVFWFLFPDGLGK